jgi:hypothetical protein
MKKILIVILALFIGEASFAKPLKTKPSKLLFKLVVVSDKQIRLFVTPLSVVAAIDILDNAGNTIFEEKLGLNHGISQQFNFSELESGDYRMVIHAGKETSSRTFHLSDMPPQRSLSIQP